MKKTLLSIFLLATGAGVASAIEDNTVEIVYSGTSATVSVASNISGIVTDVSSGSHVRLIQSAGFAGNALGEITYILSGTSADGEFYLDGAYKCSLTLNNLTLTNPSGPAINVQNGKRVKVSAPSGTVSTLADGANEDYNGCFHCKGHTEFKGKGTLNVVGNSKHAVYSKEYVEVKNLTLNITGAQKDGIHCKEYFMMESGTLNISGVADDGIQVELDGTVSTGTLADHEDEDSGNVYMLDGTLAISNYGSKAIKADGTVTYTGGTRNFDTADVTENAISGIDGMIVSGIDGTAAVYDLSGRRTTSSAKGISVVKMGGQTRKVIR